MILNKEAIEEYKQIYKKNFGEDISDKEDSEQEENLINLFRTIYRPVPVRYIKGVANLAIFC